MSTHYIRYGFIFLNNFCTRLNAPNSKKAQRQTLAVYSAYFWPFHLYPVIVK